MPEATSTPYLVALPISCEELDGGGGSFLPPPPTKCNRTMNGSTIAFVIYVIYLNYANHPFPFCI